MTIVRVGAGAAVPDLLTVEARDLLARADRVVLDDESLRALAESSSASAARVEPAARRGLVADTDGLVVHLVAGDGLEPPGPAGDLGLTTSCPVPRRMRPSGRWHCSRPAAPTWTRSGRCGADGGRHPRRRPGRGPGPAACAVWAPGWWRCPPSASDRRPTAGRPWPPRWPTRPATTGWWSPRSTAPGPSSTACPTPAGWRGCASPPSGRRPRPPSGGPPPPRPGAASLRRRVAARGVPIATSARRWPGARGAGRRRPRRAARRTAARRLGGRRRRGLPHGQRAAVARRARRRGGRGRGLLHSSFDRRAVPRRWPAAERAGPGGRLHRAGDRRCGAGGGDRAGVWWRRPHRCRPASMRWSTGPVPAGQRATGVAGGAAGDRLRLRRPDRGYRVARVPLGRRAVRAARARPSPPRTGST